MNKQPLETITLAKTIYQNWVDAMVCPKNDIDRVLNLYYKDAVLLATFSSIICTTRNQLNGYFKNLITLPTLSITTDEFISTECNKVIVNSGCYTFQYRSGDKLVTVPARFSFVYKNFDGQWLIINHHSSVLPVQATPF
jgi:hypothetical protein